MKLVEKLRKQEKACPFKFKAFLGVASHVTLFAYFVQAKKKKTSGVCVWQVFNLLLLVHRKIDHPLTFRLNNRGPMSTWGATPRANFTLLSCIATFPGHFLILQKACFFFLLRLDLTFYLCLTAPLWCQDGRRKDPSRVQIFRCLKPGAGNVADKWPKNSGVLSWTVFFIRSKGNYYSSEWQNGCRQVAFGKCAYWPKSCKRRLYPWPRNLWGKFWIRTRTLKNGSRWH